MTPPNSTSPGRVLPLREDLVGIEPYGAPQLDVPIRLNVNENPYAPSAATVETIARLVAASAHGLNRYPDRDFVGLRTELGEYLGTDYGTAIPWRRIWAANGSNEVMLHILQAFGGPGRTAVSFAPTYSMYPEYARDTHTRWVTGRREEDFTIDIDRACAVIRRERPSVVLIASPNNPTGTAVDLDAIDAMCRACAEVQPAGAPRGSVGIVVVDEAYAEFRRGGTPSALSLLDEHPNLAVSRTMSKAFALAGARLGYLAGSQDFVDALQVVRLPYHLSAVTQAVARGALRHAEELLSQVDALRVERDALVGWLESRQLPDGTPVRVAKSDANFVLFGKFADRHAVWHGLLDRGVLIRETGPDGWLRVSVGTPHEMAAFRAALTEVAL